MIRFLMIFIILCLFMSCHDKSVNTCIVEGSCITNNNPETPDTPTDNTDNNDEEEINLEGYYPMPHGGWLELTKLNDGRYRIESQQIKSENFDEGLCYHPNMSAGPHLPKADGTIVYAQNHTYSDITHGVEEDGDTIDVTESRRTEYILKINDDGLFQYEVTIRENTSIIGAVHVHRILIEE